MAKQTYVGALHLCGRNGNLIAKIISRLLRAYIASYRNEVQFLNQGINIMQNDYSTRLLNTLGRLSTRDHTYIWVCCLQAAFPLHKKSETLDCSVILVVVVIESEILLLLKEIYVGLSTLKSWLIWFTMCWNVIGVLCSLGQSSDEDLHMQH